MKAAEIITRMVDFFYVKPLRRIIPLETFRYAVCGGINMLLGWVLYALLYKYVIRGCYLDLGFVVMSPHVLALAVQFVITFFTGFWLNRNVTFSLSPLSSRRQLLRYVLQAGGALLLNYLLLKLLVEAAPPLCTSCETADGCRRGGLQLPDGPFLYLPYRGDETRPGGR